MERFLESDGIFKRGENKPFEGIVVLRKWALTSSMASRQPLLAVCPRHPMNQF